MRPRRPKGLKQGPILEAERAKYATAVAGKKTFPRFAKTLFCREALEEQLIPFIEEVSSLSNLNVNCNNTNLPTGGCLYCRSLVRES